MALRNLRHHLPAHGRHRLLLQPGLPRERPRLLHLIRRNRARASAPAARWLQAARRRCLGQDQDLPYHEVVIVLGRASRLLLRAKQFSVRTASFCALFERHTPNCVPDQRLAYWPVSHRCRGANRSRNALRFSPPER
jgi:hypothetical protein